MCQQELGFDTKGRCDSILDKLRVTDAVRQGMVSPKVLAEGLPSASTLFFFTGTGFSYATVGDPNDVVKAFDLANQHPLGSVCRCRFHTLLLHAQLREVCSSSCAVLP